MGGGRRGADITLKQLPAYFGKQFTFMKTSKQISFFPGRETNKFGDLCKKIARHMSAPIRKTFAEAFKIYDAEWCFAIKKSVGRCVILRSFFNNSYPKIVAICVLGKVPLSHLKSEIEIYWVRAHRVCNKVGRVLLSADHQLNHNSRPIKRSENTFLMAFCIHCHSVCSSLLLCRPSQQHKRATEIRRSSAFFIFFMTYSSPDKSNIVVWMLLFML